MFGNLSIGCSPPGGVAAGPPVPVSSGPPVAAASAAPTIAWKDDPRYKKYFVMLRVGVAAPQIKLKMQQDGLDESIIDRNPSDPSDYIPPVENGDESDDSDE